MCESFKCPECGFEKAGAVAELLAWAKHVGYTQAEEQLKPVIAELQRKLQAELDSRPKLQRKPARIERVPVLKKSA